jgi:Flp pilus assembly protein TadG
MNNSIRPMRISMVNENYHQIRTALFRRFGIRESRKDGFVLMTMGVSVAVLLGMLGLALDLGRTFIAKNEAQAFTDAAALAAASKLNNDLTGITAAQTEVTNSVNRWNFATQTLSGVTTEFSTDKVNWVTAPATGTGYKYVRVTAPTNTVTMTVLRAVDGIPASIAVGARTVAGAVLPTSFKQGVFPFAPIAHNLTGPNFGYSYGDELTLLWPSSVGSNGPVKMNNLCGADKNQAALDAVSAGTTSDRGYIQDTSASAIESAIVDDHMDYTVTLHELASRSGGVKTNDVYQAIQDRVNQDSQPNTTSYTGYKSSHDASPMRRVVIVPIVQGAADSDSWVLGFAYVFLPPNQPHNPNDAKCGMYIGPADDPNGLTNTGANIVRIFE